MRLYQADTGGHSLNTDATPAEVQGLPMSGGPVGELIGVADGRPVLDQLTPGPGAARVARHGISSFLT